MTGGKETSLLFGHLLQQLVAAEVRQVQIHDHAIEGRGPQLRQEPRAALRTAVICTSSFARSCAMLSRWRSSSSTMSTWRTALRELRFQPLQRLDQLLALHGLHGVAERAHRERLLGVVGDRDDVHGNVPRLRIAFELIQHAEPGMIRQVHVEQDRLRPISSGRSQPSRGRMRDHALEAHLVRQVAQDAGKGGSSSTMRISRGIRRQALAVILERAGSRAWRARRGSGCGWRVRLRRRDARARAERLLRTAVVGWRRCRQRQRQREGAASPGVLVHC